MLPKLKASAMSLTILGDNPDPKLCVELGAAILLDKPIIVFVPLGVRIPANLKRVATRIIQGDIHDPGVRAEITNALQDVVKHDARITTKQ